jgi:hypothetical protein
MEQVDFMQAMNTGESPPADHQSESNGMSLQKSSLLHGRSGATIMAWI